MAGFLTCAAVTRPSLTEWLFAVMYADTPRMIVDAVGLQPRFLRHLAFCECFAHLSQISLGVLGSCHTGSATLELLLS